MERKQQDQFNNLIVAELNILDSGSTGRIMFQLASEIRKNGGTVYTFSRGWKQNKYLKDIYHKYVGSYLTNGIHCFIGKNTGLNGYLSVIGTIRLIRFLKKKRVNVVHLHNLHAFCYNLPILFWYLKKANIKVIWTLHDCWSFTGYCMYFSMIECEKWRTICVNCEQCPNIARKLKIATFNFRLKRKLFLGINDIVLVTPSKWLESMARLSFWKHSDIRTIYNGVDFSIFKPTTGNFKIKNNLEGKKIILGVAFDWGKRKGLDVFCELANDLSNDYRIVLVGTDEEVRAKIPNNILAIDRTANQKELAEIYTSSDVFVNPTREEVLGMVNIEALACGTPVITFDSGGSPEVIDIKSGVVVPKDDIKSLKNAIIDICSNHSFKESDCIDRAHDFSLSKMNENYIRLYEEIIR